MVRITRTEYMNLQHYQKHRTKHGFWKIESSPLVSAEIRINKQQKIKALRRVY